MKIRAFTFLVSALVCASASAESSYLSQLGSAAKGAPKDAAAQLSYARALIEAKRLSEAETYMQRYVRLAGGGIEAKYEAMRVHFAKGNYRRTRGNCRELVKMDKSHVLSHVCMARAFLLWRRSSRAVEYIDKALAADPNNYEARLVRADALRIMGDWAQARAAYAEVLKVRPRSAQAHLGLGLIEVVLRKRQEAATHLRRARELPPHDPDILYELGRVSDGDEAVRLLQQALSLRSPWPDAQLALALGHLHAGDAKSAEAGLRAALKREPNNPVARAELGAALTALGRHEEAERHLKQALEAVPNDYDASFALAKLYERSGRYEEAFVQYRNAADIKREDPTPLERAAELGLRLKRPLLSKALLDKALERAPRSAKLLSLYGDALMARGDDKGAREYYRRALAGIGPVDRAHVQRRLGKLE